MRSRASSQSSAAHPSPGGHRSPRCLARFHTARSADLRTSSTSRYGKRYELAQFHVHGPSEHTVDGKHADMELHLVHRDPAGNLAVVGVFLNKGQEHPALQSVWMNMPATRGENKIEDATVDASLLLPPRLEAYTYSGSLTTPPCSEGVLWFVMVDPLELSPQQINAFRTIVAADARPVQPLNAHGRALAASR